MRVMFAGDLHKRSKDITTIEGYVECTLAVQKTLMNDINVLGVDYFVSLGDWYDKGYAVDISASLADYDLDIEMANQLNGKFYGLIGNHIRLGMDSNPELHIIQPHPKYKPRRKTPRTEQIMKTPEVLRIRDVQISFMHHQQGIADVTEYKPTRCEWAKYHIALFHTPAIIPTQKLQGTMYSYNASSTSKIAETLRDVDLAIVGDIHTPLSTFTVSSESGSTTVIVPGSLTNTDASDQNRHTTISIPIVDIDEESHVALSYHVFDLLTNRLTFNKKNVEKSMEKLRSLRGKARADLHTPSEVVSVLASQEMTYTSLNAFMQAKGYTTRDKELIRSVLNEPENLDKLLEIYSEVPKL